MSAVLCPVCADKNAEQGLAQDAGVHGDASPFDCGRCGKFVMTGSLQTVLSQDEGRPSKSQRAAVSHAVWRANQLSGEPLFLWDRGQFTDAVLIDPQQQAMNALVYYGDLIMDACAPILHPPQDIASAMGSPNYPWASGIIDQLVAQGLLKGDISLGYLSQGDLTLQGWEKYHQEKRGRFAGRYGFMAMKYGMPETEALRAGPVKQCVESIGYQLVDLRDASKAGIIDNLLRQQIRDAAFLLVDLTHKNNGAYWEAGYAEGLGKPVIYLCEKTVFTGDSTHFDTNHLTTVLWEQGKEEKFVEELVATLRRTLGLFDRVA